MDSLIETFHIDIKLLIAQMINFAIVLSVLYFFALKPLMKTMQDRTKKIEKSLKNAVEIDEKKEELEKEYKVTLAKAKGEANEIIKKAVVQSEEKSKKMIEKAKNDIGQIINEEKAKLQNEKQQILEEIKNDMVDLVTLSLEKILEKKIDSKEDMDIIKQSIK
ncbi:F0F1 ATP synthase subunit B [Candidatus Parcubacteria bacterium]|nr:F0F1 ATP synthase subunit B [Candidatus Parcubacteria bacterium]